MNGREHKTSGLYTKFMRQMCQGGMYKIFKETKRKQTTLRLRGSLRRLQSGMIRKNVSRGSLVDSTMSHVAKQKQ